MAKKTTRNKAKAAAPRRTDKRRAKRGVKPTDAPQRAACYVAVSPPTVAILATQPKSIPASGPCDGFEQTKDAALECLIAAIEEAERKLAACKRATTIEQLRSFGRCEFV
jgi:hypothetical protein